MMALLIQVVFGFVVIAMAFLIVVFWRAYVDPSKRLDRRYRLVAGALAMGKVGVLIWAFNPLSQAFGGPPLHPLLMAFASGFILLSAAMLIGSTAMGGNPDTLFLCLGVSAVYVLICIFVALQWG
jgi:hypothetical protein